MARHGRDKHPSVSFVEWTVRNAPKNKVRHLDGDHHFKNEIPRAAFRRFLKDGWFLLGWEKYSIFDKIIYVMTIFELFAKLAKSSESRGNGAVQNPYLQRSEVRMTRTKKGGLVPQESLWILKNSLWTAASYLLTVCFKLFCEGAVSVCGTVLVDVSEEGVWSKE